LLRRSSTLRALTASSSMHTCAKHLNFGRHPDRIYLERNVPTSNLVLPFDTLAIFADDTGHEHLKGCSFYGLGACAILGSEYERLIRAPWSQVREAIHGDPAAPLHASDLTGKATREQLEKVAQFFREQPIRRLGAAGTSTTNLPDGEPLMRFVVETFKRRIVDIAKWTPFKSIIVVVESNPRANRLIEQYLGEMRVEEDGRPIPVEFYFMEKKPSHDPALEVADFIANAIGNQARFNQVDKRAGFRKDFQAIFHGVDRKLVSFMGIEKVEITASHAPSSV
jgi:hypothetical protein